MAMSSQNGRGKGGRYRPLSEINITPLVDVMLVLLVIFMVTAPLMSSSVNIDLPKVSATPISQDNEPLKVQVDAQGKVYLQDEGIELTDLTAKLQAIAKDNKDRRIFVRGDKANSYGHMLEVMSTIIQGGFTKVALMTDPAGLPSPGDAPAAGAAPATAPAAAPAGTAAPAPAPAPTRAAPAIPAVQTPSAAPAATATRPASG